MTLGRRPARGILGQRSPEGRARRLLRMLLALAGLVVALTVAPAQAGAAPATLAAGITAPPQGTVGDNLLHALADLVKAFLFLVIPLLAIAALIEVTLTPLIVVWIYGG